MTHGGIVNLARGRVWDDHRDRLQVAGMAVVDVPPYKGYRYPAEIIQEFGGDLGGGPQPRPRWVAVPPVPAELSIAAVRACR